jgi:hypothetical protein
MTDAEIIKALECCIDEDFNLCNKCPIKIECYTQTVYIKKKALDLINRQQAEIERLKDMVAQNEGVLPEYENLIKAEAIKEFASDIINNILPKIMYGHNEKAFEISLAISKRTENLVGENK